jgi:hypothetical protein
VGQEFIAAKESAPCPSVELHTFVLEGDLQEWDFEESETTPSNTHT